MNIDNEEFKTQVLKTQKYNQFTIEFVEESSKGKKGWANKNTFKVYQNDALLFRSDMIFVPNDYHNKRFTENDLQYFTTLKD